MGAKLGSERTESMTIPLTDDFSLWNCFCVRVQGPDRSGPDRSSPVRSGPVQSEVSRAALSGLPAAGTNVAVDPHRRRHGRARGGKKKRRKGTGRNRAAKRNDERSERGGLGVSVTAIMNSIVYAS